MVIFDNNFNLLQDSFQERRRRILSSLRGVSSRRSEKGRHFRRQYRQGEQGRRGTERQKESYTENERTGKNLYNGNQTSDREQDSGITGHTETEQEQPSSLKIRTGFRAEPFTDSRSKVQDTKKDITNPSGQDMPKVHPILIRSKKKNVSRSLGGVSNYENQEEGDSTPDSKITIATAKISNMTDGQSLQKKNMRSGKAIRSCILLANGTVKWKEPDTSMCREEAMQVAEKAAAGVVSLTESPSAVNSSTFTLAASQLAEIVGHAINDRAVSDLYLS